jgi:hypothetical protein
VVTGMVAQEILDACEEAAAATGGGGGGGSSETNLANPALGRCTGTGLCGTAR